MRVWMVLMALLVAGPVRGQVAEITAREIVAYPLTSQKVRAAHRAQAEVARAFAANPALRPRPAGSPATLTASMVRMAEASPTIRAALRREGLTPRESLLITMALRHAVRVVDRTPRGSTASPTLLRPENAAFVRRHRAELARIQAEGAAVARGRP